MTDTLNLEGEVMDTNAKMLIREPLNKVKSVTSLGYEVKHLMHPHELGASMVMFAGFIVVAKHGEEYLKPATWDYYGEAVGETKFYGDLLKADPIIVATTRHAIMRHWVTKSLKHENRYEGAIGYIRVKYFDDNTFKVEVENDPKTLSK